MKILVVGLIQRQAGLVRQACEKRLRGVDVDLVFYDASGKRPPTATIPKADIAIETRFLGHKWHYTLEKKFRGKTYFVHGGLNVITEKIVQLATEESARARHLLQGDTKPRLAR